MVYGRRFLLVLSQALAVMLSALGAAQSAEVTYPNRPVRVIVGFSAGSTADLIARTIAQGLSETLGQPAVVENRTGANGAIGAQLAAQSTADGYTLLMVSIANTIDNALRANLPYDILRDFLPITQASQAPYVIVVNSSLPVSTIQDLINFAKTKPDQLNFGSSGAGGSNHIGTELFLAAAGLRMVHVPYRGPAEALKDVVSGQVQLFVSGMGSGLSLAQAGRVRALAVTSLQRAKVVPDVPTVAETLPGFQFIGWTGVVAPKGTPLAIINQLNAAISRILQQPKVKEQLARVGAEPVSSTPEQFREHIRRELARIKKVGEDVGIRIQ